MNANSLMKKWESLCIPAQIFPIFMTSLVLFDLYRGVYAQAISHIVFTLIGTTFLWVLCAAKLELAAYMLLGLPVIFFIFLIALIFFDQSLLNIRHKYKKCRNVCNCYEEPDCGCCQ